MHRALAADFSKVRKAIFMSLPTTLGEIGKLIEQKLNKMVTHLKIEPKERYYGLEQRR